MIKYDDDSILTGYIKKLLNDFSLPSIPVYKEGMKLFRGNYIIKDSHIQQVISVLPLELKKVFAYTYGKEVEHFTRHLSIDNNVYTATTHNYLGDYLRFQRDYNGINLMSLYNCFSNELVNSLNIKVSSGKKGVAAHSFKTEDTRYKIYMLPIKLDQLYTIAIDSELPIELVCSYYDNVPYTKESSDILHQSTYVRIKSSIFNKPFLYDKLTSLNNREIYANEKSIRLFIKIPIQNNSSIVVLEGDYRGYNDFTLLDESSTKGFKANNKSINNYEYKENNTKLISPLQLLTINSGVNHPFADRLIEYILDNAIIPNDKISDNITRIQYSLNRRYNKDAYLESGKIIHPYIGLSKIKDEGKWEDKYRNICYDVSLQSNINNKYNDLLGYVDKDIENVLGEDVDIYNGKEEE